METSKSSKRTDYLAGALMVVTGAGAIYVCSGYRMGSLTSMGPGFFPTILGALLIILGLAIAISGADSDQSPVAALQHHGGESWDIRGWACIVLAPIAFILLAERFGFLPASFFAVLIAALGDRTATLKASIALAAGMTAFAIILFVYLLQVEIPIVRLG